MEKLQIRAARALLGWSQEDLARASNVATQTIKRLEAGKGTATASRETIHAVSQAFRKAGVEFIDQQSPSHDGGFGVRLTSYDEAFLLEAAAIFTDEAIGNIDAALANEPNDARAARLTAMITELQEMRRQMEADKILLLADRAQPSPESEDGASDDDDL